MLRGNENDIIFNSGSVTHHFRSFSHKVRENHESLLLRGIHIHVFYLPLFSNQLFLTLFNIIPTIIKFLLFFFVVVVIYIATYFTFIYILFYV